MSINFRQIAQEVIEKSATNFSYTLVDSIQESLVQMYHKGQRDREDRIFLPVESTRGSYED